MKPVKNEKNFSSTETNKTADRLNASRAARNFLAGRMFVTSGLERM